MISLDRTSPMPLWAQLRDLLNERLRVGEFGDRFPTEAEIAAAYAVSRHTVREALSSLRAQGRVVAERGRGSRVVEVRQQPAGALWSLFRAVEADGRAQTSVVLRLDVVLSRPAAAELGVDYRSKLVHLERLRMMDGEPLAHDEAWLPATLARPLLDVDFTRTALYDELARRCATTLDSGEETVTAVTATPADRSLLQTPRDVPILLLRRKGFSGGRPVEWRETRVRADRFSLQIGWLPDTGRALRLAAELHA